MFAEDYVDRYKEDPLFAAETLSKIWCDRQAQAGNYTWIDLWGCDWANRAFFNAFFDRCREKGYLQAALKIKWLVHNAPFSSDELSFNEKIEIWVNEYDEKYKNQIFKEKFDFLKFR